MGDCRYFVSMNPKPIYLSPVPQEQYLLQSGAKDLLADITPEAAYAPSIAQFQKFAVGLHCWFIADMVRGTTVAAGGQLDKMLPFGIDDLVNHSPDILFRSAHPEDLTHLFAFTNYWMEYYINLPEEHRDFVHPNIYIRMQNPDKAYYWVMIQYTKPLTDNEGRFCYGLTLITDISHVKQDGLAMMSMLDTLNNSCQHFYCTNGKAALDKTKDMPPITLREREVLRLLAIGYSSKQISAELSVAANTIDNHRQNMLRKTGSKSTGELVAYGIMAGFV